MICSSPNILVEFSIQHINSNFNVEVQVSRDLSNQSTLSYFCLCVCSPFMRCILQWLRVSLLKRVKVQLFVTPWTIQSMEFSRPEYWSGQPFLFPGDLPNPGFEPRSPALQADSLPAEPQRKPKNTGVGSLSLLQWIFLTQEWVAYPDPGIELGSPELQVGS